MIKLGLSCWPHSITVLYIICVSKQISQIPFFLRLANGSQSFSVFPLFLSSLFYFSLFTLISEQPILLSLCVHYCSHCSTLVCLFHLSHVSKGTLYVCKFSFAPNYFILDIIFRKEFNMHSHSTILGNSTPLHIYVFIQSAICAEQCMKSYRFRLRA